MTKTMNQSEPNQTAILLLAHGTPDVLGEMAEYLAKVTNGRPLPQHVIEELQHRYAEIGLRNEPLPEGPPLTRWTLKQGTLLEALLREQGEPVSRVYVGMRNWHPYISDVVARMRADGVTRIKAVCLAPQNSRTSVGLYRRAVMEAATGVPGQAMQVDFVAGWADQPLLIQAFAERLLPVWKQACTATGTRTPVLFTAHSVPCRTIMSTPDTTRPNTPVPPDGIQTYDNSPTPDPYPVECKRTATHIAESLHIADCDWFFAFQSQGIAGAPWIGPTVEDTLKELAVEGHKGVVLQPVGFLCDHVEILYDIDIAFTNAARELGMQLWRPESLNDSPTLIKSLAEVVSGRYQSEVEDVAIPVAV
jgi:protoporphyrin/coproporphyrin ferrochelatase